MLNIPTYTDLMPATTDYPEYFIPMSDHIEAMLSVLDNEQDGAENYEL